MEEYRIGEKNKIFSRIKEINTYIKRNESTIERFEKQTSKTNFEKTQIKKLLEKNSEYENDIKELNLRVENLAKGLLDNEIIQELNKENEKILKSNIKANKKHTDKKEKEEENKKLVKKSYNINNHDFSEKDLDKEFNKFNKFYNSVPNYILRNLKEMPNNKGYLWKGIWCLGELPPEKGEPNIIFEKLQESNILRIYEIDNNFTSIYEKLNKDKKKLVSKTHRTDFLTHFNNWKPLI